MIAKPRKRLGGHAICPYLQQYMDRISLVESVTPMTVAENFATFHRQFGLEAVIVYGFDWDFDTVHKEVDAINKKFKTKDVECLAMCPDSVKVHHFTIELQLHTTSYNTTKTKHTTRSTESLSENDGLLHLLQQVD